MAHFPVDNEYLAVWVGFDNGGALGDGETEIFGQRFEIGDFGDAPDSYSTRLENIGAWHHLGTPLFLGTGVDADDDGRPTANAKGDDSSGSDDEDGVTIGALTPGSTSTISVVASASGRLDAFVDFNRDGDFADLSEKIFQSVVLSAGSNSLTFSVPAEAKQFGRDELPLVTKVADMAHTWIYQQNEKNDSQSDDPESKTRGRSNAGGGMDRKVEVAVWRLPVLPDSHNRELRQFGCKTFRDEVSQLAIPSEMNLSSKVRHPRVSALGGTASSPSSHLSQSTMCIACMS